MGTRRLILSFAMCVTLFWLFDACKDKGTESPPQRAQLSADSTSVRVEKGSSRQVTLSGGTEPYSIKTQPNGSIATASISSAFLTISAVDTGTTFIVVNDNSTATPDTIRISIYVFSAAVHPTVHFATQLQLIFNSRCTGCHGNSGGLSLASGSSYANLVNVQSASSCTSFKRVLPGSADNSTLYRKVSGTTCGGRMPQGGTLSVGEIALIQTWINEGAGNN